MATNDCHMSLYQCKDAKVSFRFDDWEDAGLAVHFLNERCWLATEKHQASIKQSVNQVGACAEPDETDDDQCWA